MVSKSSPSLTVRRILRIVWISLLLAALALAHLSAALANPTPLQPAGPDAAVRGIPWTGGMGITETTLQIMARQAEKDARGVVEPPGNRQRANLDYLLPAGPAGPGAASSGSVQNGVTRAPDANLPQTLGLNFKADQKSNSVPPDTMGTPGPTQFLAASNDRLRTFSKTTGALDGALDVTLNTFFASVNGSPSTFDEIARYDRISQRYFVTAENGDTPNKIFIAVSNAPSITSATAWTFHSFDISQVSPAGDSTCFADYPTTGIDANALIIGVNNFCPTAYASSAVYIVRKSSVLSGGPMVVTAFRNISPVTPRGVNSWDPDPGGTAPSYLIGMSTTSQVRLRRILDPAGTPSLSGFLNVSVPAVATPIALEHLGNNHPGGTNNGKIDASDTRFMPVIKRNGVLWATQGTAVNSSGIGSSSGDRDGVRWYQITNLDTTPTLAQSGTIFDSALTNPMSYTYGTLAVTGQGHAAFGFSAISAVTYNSAAYTGRLASDSAGFTNLPQVFVNGVGAYNAFDKGTIEPQRWGDYSQTSLDPCDDMTVWTVQEFTAQANTAGLSNALWGTQVAQLRAPLPAAPASATPALIQTGTTSVDVTITGTSSSGTGFFDTPSSNTDACRRRIHATVSGGVTVNSITYTDPTHVTLNLSTVSASAGAVNVTITNPDGQSAMGTGILKLASPDATTTGVSSSMNPSVYGQSVTFTATVTSVTGTPNTGTVSFYDGPNLLGVAAVDGSGVATLATNALAAGLHPISAAYSGGGIFQSSSGSLAGGQTVNQAAASVTLLNLNQTYDGNPKPISASTVPPGLTVAFTYNSSSTPPSNAGSYPVTGTVVDPNYSGTASGTLLVKKAAATVNLSNLIQTYNGNPRPISASTIPPGLTVTFTYNGSSTPPSNAGSYSVTGTVVDLNYSGTASGTLLVSQVGTNAALVSSINPSTFGKPVTFTVTVTSPSGLIPAGPVTFTVDGVPVGAILDGLGVAVFTTSALTPGNHAIAVSFDGSTNFSASAPANLTQAVRISIFIPMVFH